MIGVFNIQENLKSQLKKGHELCDLSVDENIDSIFLDWVPQSDLKFGRQAEIVEKYVRKKIPTVIFDRFLSMTYKEYIWLKRFNVFFFEPAINNRIGFTYVPQWTEPIDDFWDSEYRKEQNERQIDLFYTGNLDNKIKSFEKYYKEYASLNPDKTIIYQGTFRKQYDDYNIKSLMNWNGLQNVNLLDIKYTILLGSATEYRIGYLPDNFFTYMQHGILPLLPFEHRFFHGMFGNSTVENEKDIDFIINKKFENIRYIMIECIYYNIDNYFPEFKINHIIDKIKHYLKL